MAKARVFWVVEYFPTRDGDITGGVESRTWYLAHELAKTYDLTILTSWKRGQPRRQHFSTFRVLRVGRHHPYTNEGGGAFLSRLAFMRAVIQVGKTLTRPHLIEGHNFISYLPAYKLATFFGVPAVATYHEVWLGKWMKTKGVLTGLAGAILERSVLRKPWGKIIAVSRVTQRQLLRQGTPKEKIKVIPNGIVTIHEQKKFRIPTICYLGRLTETKRVEDLLYATKLLQEMGKTARLIIIGSGPRLHTLKRLAHRLGVNADFKGFVEDKKSVEQSLARSHLFCSPSVLEGFGITLIEACAAGTPYVATNIAAYKEVTKQAKGGILVPPRSPEALAAALDLLLEDKALYQQKRNEAQQLAKNYLWKDLAKDIDSSYKELIQE